MPRGLQLITDGTQISFTAFMHGSGNVANPPTLFLDALAPPNSTAKYRDSSIVNFAAGNSWKEIGTWSGSLSGVVTGGLGDHALSAPMVRDRWQ